MEYFVGVDGGATKTLAVVGDRSGRVLGAGLSGPSNYQIVGLEFAMESIKDAIRQAEAAAGVSGGEPAARAQGAVFGLAGADFPIDFERLNQGCAALMGDCPFRVVNDCWIALRGGTSADWGVVAINGTGANYAGRNRRGEEIILRGMGYEMGNRGGGGDIMREALHWAFRAEDGTGPATALSDAIPRAVGMASLDAIAEALYTGTASPALGLPIVPLVFELANQGDAVAQEILITIGNAMGQTAGGIARRLGIADEEFDVVLAGSVWRGVSPLLRDQFTTALHRLAPRAVPRLPLFEPAVGAYMMALEQAGIALDAAVRSALGDTAGRIASIWGFILSSGS